MKAKPVSGRQAELHPAATALEQLAAQCQLRFTRRSGPGGQHRNKVQTAVVVTHLPSGLQAEANERRSQDENRRVALFRLRVRLALSVRHVPAADGQPAALWRARLRQGQIAINPAHDDFPALLAEALDVLEDCGWQPKPAAKRLACTPSQLMKFVKLEPQAWLLLNQKRRGLKLRPLL